MKFIIQDSLEDIRHSADYLWESVRNGFTALDRLRKILGHAGRRDLLDHFREAATGVPQPLDLPDDIVGIVCQTRQAVWLCEQVVQCRPPAIHRNFDKIQAAAPGIIAADRLERSWATWHEYRKTDDVREYAQDVHELLAAGTPVGFLMQSMGEFYFRIGTYEDDPADFLQLFLLTEDWPAELASSLQLMAATHVATYFRAAAESEIPNRPDVICRMHYLLTLLKKDILDFENKNYAILEGAAKYGALRTITSKPYLIESDPDLEKFYQDQWERHFADFALPVTTANDEEDDVPDADAD